MGAAVGLKLLEVMEEVRFAVLFYGVPPLKGARASKLKCPVTLYAGEEDRIRGLSEGELVQKAIKVYSNNPFVEIVGVKGAKHGFMNPACPHYSEATFKTCAAAFQEKARAVLKEAKQKAKLVREEGKKEGKGEGIKKEDDGCVLI